MKLTETIIKALPTPAKPMLYSDDSTTGLYLKHSIAGRITFVLRRRKQGVWDVRTLGTYPDMDLNKARRMALKLGKASSSAVTFGDLLDEWFDTQIEPHYKVTKNISTYIAKGKAELGNRRCDSLTTREMVDVLKRYAKSAPVAANRCLSNWKLCLDYGVQSGYLENNPLARTQSRTVGGKEEAGTRVLTDDEIRAVWASGESLLRFLLLTGLRISEAQHGRLEGATWHCDMTKNGKPHWVHCPALALAQISEWTTSPTAVQAKLKRWCERHRMEPFTPHDLRRTFVTRLNAMGVEPYIVEKMVNHSMPGVMAVYNHADYRQQRIDTAELWAREVQKIIDS